MREESRDRRRESGGCEKSERVSGEERSVCNGWVETGEMNTQGLDFRQLQGALPRSHPRWRQSRAAGGHRHAEGADLKARGYREGGRA